MNRRPVRLVSATLCWFAAAALSAGRHDAILAAEPDGDEAILHQKDIAYGTGGGETLHLDLARRRDLSAPAAAIVVIHGGAWRAGNKKQHTDLIIDFARRGYVAATVQYRFCPKHTFPAQIEDVKCAVRYLRAHADQLKIDPKRIGAVGFSAGAHLSMMLGTMGPGDGLEGQGGWMDQPSQVQCVVAFFGPTELAADDIPPISVKLVSDFLGGSKTEIPGQYKKASPVSYVNRGDAPTLIFQGTKDPLVPHTQAYLMAEALTKASVPGRVELFLGAGHGWGGRQLQHSREQMVRFFDRYLRPPNGAVQRPNESAD